MARFKITQRLAATAVAAAVLAGMAVPTLAQPGPGPAAAAEQGAPQTPRLERGERPRQRALTPEQREQYLAQRAEAFKRKLQLTAEQEPAWNSFLQSMKPDANARKARLDLQGMDQLTTPERIDRMRALRAQRAAEMDRRGDAVKAFYATLTPAQQKTFDTEGARMYRHWGDHPMGKRWGEGPRGEFRGDGRGYHHGMRHHGPGPGAAPAQGAPLAPQ